jgi:hypothetical protein
VSYPRAGDPTPLHPDQFGWPRARVLNELGSLPALTDAEMNAMWEQEQEFRSEVAAAHSHWCGHRCESGACALMAGMQDRCIACQLAEVSDKEAHQAARRAREKSA